MILGVRRALTGLAAGMVISLGAVAGTPAQADTPTPTPPAATAPAADDGAEPAPDNSRQAWALGGAGAVALIVAAAVYLRRT